MVRVGNFLFHYRNGLFPLAYAILFVPSARLIQNDYLALGLGLFITISGQFIRVVTIGLVYIRRGGKNRQVYADRLVQDGIFGHCRNPLYVGNFLMILGLGFVANSLLFLGIGIPLFLFIYWAIILAEEDFLLKKFGTAYQDYCKDVPRAVPKLTGLITTWSKHAFNWRRVIVKEYGTTFICLLGLILLLEKNQLLRQAYGRNQIFQTVVISTLSLTLILFSVARILKKREILVG
jgi:protein-S-isoprenylcysteine O-methyltransferase Ste14